MFSILEKYPMLIKTTDACRIQMSLGLFDGDIGIDTGFFSKQRIPMKMVSKMSSANGIRSSGLPNMLFLVTVCLYCD